MWYLVLCICIPLVFAEDISATSSRCIPTENTLPNIYHIGRSALKIFKNSAILSLNNKANKKVLDIDIGLQGQPVGHIQSLDGHHLELTWSDQTTLKLNHFNRGPMECIRVIKMSTYPDCLDMGTSFWYGGSEMRFQYWPINTVNVSTKPYVAHDTGEGMFGSVCERYFLSSDGVGVWAEEDQPLFASINSNGNNQICLNVNNTNPYSYESTREVKLTYEVCTESDIKAVHQGMKTAHFKKPSGIPNEALFRWPIWSTWSEYKADINQTIVLDFFNAILEKNFSIGQFEIDDNWTPKYGDLVFKKSTFPDPKGMIQYIHSKKIPVALWVHPFLNSDSQGFSEASKKGFLVKDPTGSKPALTKWWNGNNTGVIDFTNPGAVDWFLEELSNLQALGIDAFKYDAGETNYLPITPFRLYNNTGNPDTYVSAYARIGSRVDPKNRVEIRTGVQTQDLPFMVRMSDRYSTWTYDEGIKTLVTTALTFSILGYPFVLPDYIGGNGYNGNIPDSEIYIRWVQANALMPLMQFSYTPWFFKNDTVMKVTRDMVNLHEQYSDKIIALAKDSMVTGDPIMRPMWWIAPRDTPALQSDSQFMLGDDVIVAPVLDKGVTSRKIYLPMGKWKDEITGQTIIGPQTFDYPVTLEDLPRFTKTT